MSQLQLFADPTPPVPDRRERKRPTDSNPRTTNAELFDTALQASGLPFVAVDEAKRATIRDAKLRAFHFIVYAQDCPNWLVYVGPRRESMVEAMRDWQATFGDGFKALFAVFRGDAIAYRALDGEAIERPFDTEVRP